MRDTPNRRRRTDVRKRLQSAARPARKILAEAILLRSRARLARITRPARANEQDSATPARHRRPVAGHVDDVLTQSPPALRPPSTRRATNLDISLKMQIFFGDGAARHAAKSFPRGYDSDKVR